MSLDFKGELASYHDVSDDYSSPTTRHHAIDHAPDADRKRGSYKRLLIIKPKKQQKEWIQREQQTDAGPIFKSLAATIRSKYAHLSNLETMMYSEEYLAVIGLGARVIPFILADMRSVHSLPWFWALKAITRENVGSEVAPGDFRGMTEAWLAWGHNKELS